MEVMEIGPAALDAVSLVDADLRIVSVQSPGADLRIVSVQSQGMSFPAGRLLVGEARLEQLREKMLNSLSAGWFAPAPSLLPEGFTVGTGVCCPKPGLGPLAAPGVGLLRVRTCNISQPFHLPHADRGRVTTSLLGIIGNQGNGSAYPYWTPCCRLMGGSSGSAAEWL